MKPIEEHTKVPQTTPAPPPSGPVGKPAAAQLWNTSAYAANGRFVATMATAVLDLLDPQAGEAILDVGCGDGALTARIAATGARVTGIDASPEMVAAARERGLDVLAVPAREIAFPNHFDAVFSNAALHWIPEAEQAASLDAIGRALRPGGRFVAEMGGAGNIAAIRTALLATLLPLGIDPEAAAASFFPSPAAYAALLEAAGFGVDHMELDPRPTPLPGGPDGMTLWLETFRNGVFRTLDPDARSRALAATADLLRPVLMDPGSGLWTADYVRLRFRATRL